MYADLHIHTTHSDGTFSPLEVVKQAQKYGVGLIAVADHECTSGAREILPLCEAAGIACIPACELSAMFRGIYLHILAYGVDIDEPAFDALVRRNRNILDKMSTDLIAVLAKTDKRLSLSEYEEYKRDITRGGWKGIDYLYAKGVVKKPMDGAIFYNECGITYESAGFPDLSEVFSKIRQAGGVPFVAHPALAKTENMEKLLYDLAENGLGGIECYYPKHTPEMVKLCLRVCEERCLGISAGSDCHGAFGSARVGQTDTLIEQVRLKGIPQGNSVKGKMRP